MYACARMFPQKRNCVYADNLQMNLHQWVNNPKSLFYAQPMVRYVHRLMKKTHNLMLHKVRALGVEVVQASFHQVVLNTKKTQWEQAQSLIEFVQSELAKTPWGQLLTLRAENYWARLLWVDRYNFAGLEEGSEENDRVLGKALTDPDLLRMGLVLRSEWEFGEHLPKKHKQVLHELIADFVCMPYKFRLAEMDAEMEDAQGASQSTPGLTQKRRTIAEVDKTEVLYSKELFQSPDKCEPRLGKDKESSPHFSRKLYEVISKESSSVGKYPRLPGSHQEFGVPQLELLKQACHVFALDNDVKNEVANMKRALLRVLKVVCVCVCVCVCVRVCVCPSRVFKIASPPVLSALV
jgi:DNA polymerase epsilon subunit 1